VFLRDRADILRMRLLAVKSKACANKSNKYICPEIFLDAVADKLTTTADLFIDAELLSKFYYQVRSINRVLQQVTDQNSSLAHSTQSSAL
jgi:replication fork clamp-binding protein CrfC